MDCKDPFPTCFLVGWDYHSTQKWEMLDQALGSSLQGINPFQGRVVDSEEHEHVARWKDMVKGSQVVGLEWVWDVDVRLVREWNAACACGLRRSTALILEFANDVSHNPWSQQLDGKIVSTVRFVDVVRDLQSKYPPARSAHPRALSSEAAS